MPNNVLNLAGAKYVINADAGDNLSFAFTATATNTTGWTLEFRFYADGTLIVGATLTNGSGITNTPGTDSLITIAIPAATTAPYAGQSLTTEFIRTDAGFVRTLAKGPMNLS